jgi:hypothetical protein
VRRGNEIDVTAAVVLQAEHSFNQFSNRYLAAVPLMADIGVLAENAAEVATSEKYGA